MSARQLTHDDYSVGWLCVLECEIDAARALLDEEDEPLPPKFNDDNSYLLGRMGEHNVVIAFPDSYGTSPATQTVTNMIRTFPRIRFGLMVGVGGGAPKSPHAEDSKKDLRLGDIVIGEPRGNHGGVLQYDLGKSKDSNQFAIESHLNKPPGMLLKAMKRAKADERFKKSKMLDYLREAMETMRDLEFEGFEFPGRQHDHLFDADYAHVEGEDCQNCDIQQAQRRVDRPTENPVIHYGLIASGNAVMRSAQRRDELRDTHDVLCFEMEAAGLMNYFPCVVIRGICDYSDGHKNKRWQSYAAVVSAAYAKDLLRVIHPGEVIESEEVAVIIKEFTEAISSMDSNVSKIGTAMKDDFRQKVLQWLSPIDYGEQQSEFLSRRTAGTGQWLLISPEFQTWVNQGNQTLFCPGIAGAGKTIMTSVVIDYLNSKHRNASDVGIAYMYCNYRSQQHQRPTDVLLSLLKQLTRGRQEIPHNILELYETHSKKGTRPTDIEISELLTLVTRLYYRAFVIIDALDEYHSLDAGAPRLLLTELFRIQSNSSLNLFATSREVGEITSQFDECMRKDIRAQGTDILLYVDTQMPRLCPSRISSYPDVQTSIRDTIVMVAEGMFLLAKLHMESLLGQPTIGELEEALTRLPRGEGKLDETYTQAMERIEKQSEGYSALAKRTLSWLTYSKRALSLSEIQHALAVRPGATVFDEKFIADAITLGSICAGLIIVDEKSGIIDFIHYTTKEHFEGTDQLSNAKIDISTTCITYLSLDAFNDGVCSSNDTFESRLRKNPFYDYAARNWGHHAQEAAGQPEELIFNFLSSEDKVSAAYQAMIVAGSPYFWWNYIEIISRSTTSVHLAAQFGFMNVMIKLLCHCHDPDSKTSHGRTPLSLAAENGHFALVWLLLTTRQVEPDSKDDTGRTPLFWAAANGHKDVMILLLVNAKVDPECRDNDGRTPLLFAAWNGHGDVVWQLLHDKRVNTDSVDNYGWTPLLRATQADHDTAVWYLATDKRVKLDSRDSTFGMGVLDMAAILGNSATIQLLLRQGADLKSANKDGWTPLYFAAHFGHPEVVQLFLDHGADFSFLTTDGESPVSTAMKRGHLEVFKLLLDYGADMKSTSMFGRSPLHIAAWKGHIEEVRLWIDYGADLETTDLSGLTPINSAAWKNNCEVVQLLIDCGADLNAADNYGSTPINNAASSGHLKVVQLLLDHGADLSVPNNYGCTPVNNAAYWGHSDVVHLLLEHGADPNAENEHFNGREGCKRRRLRKDDTDENEAEDVEMYCNAEWTCFSSNSACLM